MQLKSLTVGVGGEVDVALDGEVLPQGARLGMERVWLGRGGGGRRGLGRCRASRTGRARTPSTSPGVRRAEGDRACRRSHGIRTRL